MLFKGKNKSQNEQISLRINNDIIKQVSSVRFLGLIIDKGLTWKEHIDSVSKNIKSQGRSKLDNWGADIHIFVLYTINFF